MIGRTIGNYIVRAKVGEGGMGAVYVAEHPHLGRRVAIKVLHPGVDRNPEVVHRFFNEAKAATEIRNEHIVEVLDFGELPPEGVPYLVMEWLEGESLGEALRKAPRQTVQRTASVVRGISQALKAAHAKGVIHRDLKPDNVFLLHREGAPDFVKVLDFGIAKLLQANDSNRYQTQTGAIIGTPAYMSPEQCRGAKHIDTRTDVYSLGVIAYQMLTGRLPFAADALGELLFKHLRETPPPPAAVHPEIPAAVSEIVARALEKDPEKRPSLEQIADVMDSGAGAEPGGAVLPSGAVSLGRSAPAVSAPVGAGLPGAAPSVGGSMAGGTLVAPVGTDSTVLPQGAHTTLRGTASQIDVDGVDDRLSRASPGRSRILLMAALGVAAVTVVVGVLVIRRPGAVDPGPAGHPTEPANAAAPPAPPATARIEIHTDPVTARLQVDGVAVANPLVADRPADGRVHRVVATLPGFGSIEQPLSFDRDRTVVLKLVPVPLPAAPPIPAAVARPTPAPGRPRRTPRQSNDALENAGTGGQRAGYHGSTKLKIETDFP